MKNFNLTGELSFWYGESKNWWDTFPFFLTKAEHHRTQHPAHTDSRQWTLFTFVCNGFQSPNITGYSFIFHGLSWVSSPTCKHPDYTQYLQWQIADRFRFSSPLGIWLTSRDINPSTPSSWSVVLLMSSPSKFLA